MKQSEAFDKLVNEFNQATEALPFKKRTREDMLAGYKQGVANALRLVREQGLTITL